jgi:HSP20 family protein
MAQSRWDPFAGIASLQREINRLLEDFLEGEPQERRNPGAYRPAVEMTETPEALIVRVQIPGVQKEDIQLQVSNDTLTITGNVRKTEAEHHVHHREFGYGAFTRSMPLPVSVQAEQATAQLKDGLLTVRLPKSEQTRGRDIPIQA